MLVLERSSASSLAAKWWMRAGGGSHWCKKAWIIQVSPTFKALCNLRVNIEKRIKKQNKKDGTITIKETKKDGIQEKSQKGLSSSTKLCMTLVLLALNPKTKRLQDPFVDTRF